MLITKKMPVGLDIGSAGLKAAQVREKDGKYELQKFGMLPLLPGLIEKGSVTDPSRLRDSIREVLRKADIKGREAVISFPRHTSSIITFIKAPLLTGEALESRVQMEAEKVIPFDIESVKIDYQVIASDEVKDQMDVLLVALKRDKADEYVSIVKDSGLKPAIIDLDIFALQNIHEINYETTSSTDRALVDIGSDSIKISIISGGKPSFTREIMFGSSIITSALQKSFNIPFDLLQRLIRGEAVEEITKEEAAGVIAAASERIFTEINRSFDLYRRSAPEPSEADILISGGCAQMNGFRALLAERSGMPVEVLDPFRNISISNALDETYIREISPTSAVSIGLALRRADDR